MNGIIGMAQLLLESNLEGEHREMIDVIRASGHSLLAIINDALEFSRIDAGRIEIEAMDFDPASGEQFAALQPPPSAGRCREVQRAMTCPQGEGRPEPAAPGAAQLAANAIRFTDRGPYGCA